MYEKGLSVCSKPSVMIRGDELTRGREEGTEMKKMLSVCCRFFFL